MKKEITSIFSSPLHRACAYILTFMLGTALFEFLRFIFHYSRSVTPAVILLVLFVTIGILIIHQRTLLSRITSASVMLALGFIAIGFNTHFIPSPYLLLLALAISYFGSRSFLHAKYSLSQASLIGAYIAVVSLLFVLALVRINIMAAQQSFSG